MLRTIKWLIWGLLILLAVIVSFQNLTPIQVRFLLAQAELPQAVVLASALALGFVIGLLTSALWRVRAWRAKAAREKQHANSDTQT
ncbi:MAG: LapA family protein [Pirellulaceae bacterium]|nr:LapA family protein [Pirellulaceae bacterium]